MSIFNCLLQLARRLYRAFIKTEEENIRCVDLESAFDHQDEADAAFSMFDRDLNGDISCNEMELACVEIGRERKAITASLKDLDGVVRKLDECLTFLVVIIVILVFLSLISKSTAGMFSKLILMRELSQDFTNQEIKVF
jgi:hypothetical protein